MKEQEKEQLEFKELLAMGVGGMVGGGIFSVLGLAVSSAGHAAPIAFALGGLVALLTGWSYARLGLIFHSAGGSFTYMEHAYCHRNIAAMGGWFLLAGYIGTLALYAYTFGVYGSVMLGGSGHGSVLQHVLATGILLVFLGLNLYSVRATGHIEDLIVIVKVIILLLFAAVGLFSVKADHLLPVLDQGTLGMVMGAALIFVAYEGFELIPNAVNDMKRPQQDLPRSIMVSILITIVIYILVSLVAVGNLFPAQIIKYKEYALAIAAKPFLGHTGFILIGLGAVLSTASAINATLFGTARLGKVMAQDEALPCVFSIKERTRDIPWVSLCIISGITILFVNLSDLTDISSFASSTFLLVFSSINFSAFRLRRRINIYPSVPLTGLVLCLSSWAVLCAYLWQHNPRSLRWMIVSCLAIAVMEILFSERRIFFKR